MTLGQLIAVLQGMPPNLEVFVGDVATQQHRKVVGAHVVTTKGIVSVNFYSDRKGSDKQ